MTSFSATITFSFHLSKSPVFVLGGFLVIYFKFFGFSQHQNDGYSIHCLTLLLF